MNADQPMMQALAVMVYLGIVASGVGLIGAAWVVVYFFRERRAQRAASKRIAARVMDAHRAHLDAAYVEAVDMNRGRRERRPLHDV